MIQSVCDEFSRILMSGEERLRHWHKSLKLLQQCLRDRDGFDPVRGHVGVFKGDADRVCIGAGWVAHHLTVLY
jgi:hypothetical protein